MGPNEIAKDFDADYIIHIDLTEFSHKAENSPGLYQGRTQGQVNAYKVSKDGKTKRADSVFTTEYSSEFPPNAPMSANQASGEIFLHKYEKRISDELARMFYDHPAGDEIP